MLDRTAFLRPIAHRGLHAAKRGIIENTLLAFEAAIAKGYGIECDLRPAAGGHPVVFHDLTLTRLVGRRGPIAALDPAALKQTTLRDGATRIPAFAELLDLVDGRVPLLVEIKSEWDPPDRVFLGKLCKMAQGYRGPIALMSFDPAVMASVKELCPGVPRGIVSGNYTGAGWWNRKITKARALRLRDLLESAAVAPDFFAYQIGALPTPVTQFTREVLGLPLFTWTVRSAKDRASAAKWADAAIFEGFEP